MMRHLQPNTTLQCGKYRIERVLGQGGFGITYLARNTVFDVNVAIKEFFMKDENGRDGNSVTMPNTTKSELFYGQKEKFKKEAKRMFAIKNEHIIGVHDLFEENGTAYYVMDYIDGESLAARMKRTGKPMTENEVNNILPQILDALKVIHDNGIWHLDLKPANIMIDKAGNVKLIDFGASKQMNAQKGGATTSTAISYTNGYAPREQMEQNYDKFGPWTDFYALGATLYTLLTNKRPPLPTDIDDDISKDKHLALPFPNSVSKEMKSQILWLMQTNRNRRPQSIDEFVSDKPIPTSVDDVKKDSSITSDETLIMGRKDEETIIETHPQRQPKEEPRKVFPPTNKNDSTLTGKNKERNNKGDNSNKKIGWLMLIAIIIIMSGGIYLLRSQSNNPSQFADSLMEDSTLGPSIVSSEIVQASQSIKEDSTIEIVKEKTNNTELKNDEDDSHVIYGEWFQPHNAGHHILFFTNGNFRYSPDCVDCQDEYGTYIVQGGRVIMNFEDGSKLVLNYGSIDNTSIYYLTKKNKSYPGGYEYYFVKSSG